MDTTKNEREQWIWMIFSGKNSTLKLAHVNKVFWECYFLVGSRSWKAKRTNDVIIYSDPLPSPMTQTNRVQFQVCNSWKVNEWRAGRLSFNGLHRRGRLSCSKFARKPEKIRSSGTFFFSGQWRAQIPRLFLEIIFFAKNLLAPGDVLRRFCELSSRIPAILLEISATS